MAFCILSPDVCPFQPQPLDTLWAPGLGGSEAAERFLATPSAPTSSEPRLRPPGQSRAPWALPVNGMLVQLAKLPVHGEDVHVVVLLKVPGQQLHRVVSSLQALLILVDLLHLWEQRQVTKRLGSVSQGPPPSDRRPEQEEICQAQGSKRGEEVA